MGSDMDAGMTLHEEGQASISWMGLVPGMVGAGGREGGGTDGRPGESGGLGAQ